MGIPAYFSYIIKHNSKILQSIHSTNIHHLLLDSNSIIYDCIQDNNEQEIIQEVCKKLDYYIHLFKPSKSVYIAFDGVAPAAKLKQQRERRVKGYYTKQLSNTTGWNSAAITPGTNFMNNLSKNIHQYFKYKFSNIKVIISTSLEKGEGEHKLCQYLREKHCLHDNVVLYGLDADLIMLGLIHSRYCKSIYLYRETPIFIKQLNRQLDPNKHYFLNLQIFKQDILQTMNHGSIQSNYQKNRLYDYIFLCFLLGNDFLPHFPALNIRKNGMNTILDCYNKTIKKTTKSIIYKNIIQWPLFRKFIVELINLEEELIKKDHNHTISKINSSWTIEERLNRLPQYNKRTEHIIQVGKSGWQERYYQELFFIDKTPQLCKSIAQNYLEGLEWTFKYYTNGCNNWEWYYKWSYPPLLQDLYPHIPIKYKEYIKENNHVVDPITQLAYVLPEAYYDLIPQPFRKRLSKLKSLKPSFEWAYCRYFWESHLTSSFVTIKELEKILNI